MPMKYTFLFFWVWLISLGYIPLWGQVFPEKPTGFVSDYAGVLQPQERAELERFLRAFRDSTSNEIAVVFFPDLQGYDIETFTGTLARKWGVGGKENNGVLLAFFMKERMMRIEVGYGLEGALPDALTAQIRNQYLVPAFRTKRYYDGIRRAVIEIAHSANLEYHQQTRTPRNQKRSNDFAVSMLVVALIVFVLYWFSRRRGGKGGGGSNGGSGFFFVGPTYHGSSYGGYGGGTSSSDFGGFGGGDFGGGGSSGDW